MNCLSTPRSINSPVNLTQNVTTAERNYALNIDRTLMKKLKATRRPSIEYKHTDGGITATFDAVSFELFKIALSEYYSQYPSTTGVAEIHLDKDKKGNIVQVVYKVKLNEGHGYTINLYTTRSSTLINGKATDFFMNEELKYIHQIISTAKFNNQKIDISSWNEALEGQLVALICTGDQPNISADKHDLLEKKTCYACKRNVKTRAILCDTGNHWVHYKCDKLSDEQINLLEHDDSNQYCCKMCSKKVVESQNGLLIIPKLTNIEANTQTCAEKLLEEQNDCESNECSIGSEIITNQDDELCESCNMVVHSSCTTNISGLIYCDGCATFLAQTEQVNEPNTNQIDTIGDIVSVDELRIPAVCNADTDKDDSCNVNHTENKQSKNVQPLKNATKISATQPKNSKITKSRQNVSNEQENDNSAKQSDIRQLELKLKKKQEELKVQEAKLIQIKDDKLRLESYIQKIEARNEELEQSNRLLRRRIGILEDDSTQNTRNVNLHNNSSNNGCDTRVDETDQVIVGIRDRITRFVLNKVDQQLSMLENNTRVDSCGIQNSSTHLQMPFQSNINSQMNYNNGPVTVNQSPIYPHPVKSYTDPVNRQDLHQGPYVFIPPSYSYQSAHMNNSISDDILKHENTERQFRNSHSQSSTYNSDIDIGSHTLSSNEIVADTTINPSSRTPTVTLVNSVRSESGNSEVIDLTSPSAHRPLHSYGNNIPEYSYQLGKPLQSRPILKNSSVDNQSCSKDTETDSNKHFLDRVHRGKNKR